MRDVSLSESRISRRTVAAAAAVLAAVVILQVSLVARLALPVGRPDLVIVLLSCAALVCGPFAGAVLGFMTGLFGDLASTHVLGQSALVLTLVGYGVGLCTAAWEEERSLLVPLAAAASASAAGALGHVGMAAILGDVAMTGGQALARALGAALYALVLAPPLFPLVESGLRGLEGARP